MSDEEPSSKYRRVKHLGSGSNGQVFLVREIGCEREWVYKEIQLARRGRTSVMQAYAEAKLLEALWHPHIIGIKEAFRTLADKLVLVLEYAPEGDLSQWLRRASRPLPEEIAQKMIAQLCLAVEFVHQRRIIHQDIKPSNIFITKGDLKLGDFGAARALSESNPDLNVVMGTPLYLAPEVVLNEGHSFKSDVWSLGCVAYEILCGKPPFYHHSYSALAEMICSQPIAAIDEFYSSSLRAFVSSMLTRNQGQRPSMSDLVRSDFFKEMSRFLPGFKAAKLSAAPHISLGHQSLLRGFTTLKTCRYSVGRASLNPGTQSADELLIESQIAPLRGFTQHIRENVENRGNILCKNAGTVPIGGQKDERKGDQSRNLSFLEITSAVENKDRLAEGDFDELLSKNSPGSFVISISCTSFIPLDNSFEISAQQFRKKNIGGTEGELPTFQPQINNKRTQKRSFSASQTTLQIYATALIRDKIHQPISNMREALIRGDVEPRNRMRLKTQRVNVFVDHSIAETFPNLQVPAISIEGDISTKPREKNKKQNIFESRALTKPLRNEGGRKWSAIIAKHADQIRRNDQSQFPFSPLWEHDNFRRLHANCKSRLGLNMPVLSKYIKRVIEEWGFAAIELAISDAPRLFSFLHKLQPEVMASLTCADMVRDIFTLNLLELRHQMA